MLLSIAFKLLVLLFLVAGQLSRAELPGTWEVLIPNAGIASMHTAVTHLGTVVLLDRTNIGPSNFTLSPRHPHCRRDPVIDCTAHSALLDPLSRSLRPLRILTDTWCSSGQFLPDGTLLQTGGDLDGLRKIRTLSPSSPNSDWFELSAPSLSAGRWYATNQILPNGTVIIIGGRASPSVEFYPPSYVSTPFRPFPFLQSVQDAQMDNLYPFVHLLPDGTLFVFANSRSIKYDPATGEVIREYPPLDGGPRNYPSAGSSVMLPLNPPDYSAAEIVVCGGAQYGVYLHKETNALAGTTCGRMTATVPDPAWVLEEMPFPRIMGDMILLPTGEVLIINGAQAGAQGFEMASNPALNPVLYRPDQPIGLRFMTLNPTTVPRMYHSTANLLPDGRVLLAGSNPHYFYKFGSEFPTELRIEAFSPEYLAADKANIRPSIEVGPETVGYATEFEVEVAVSLPAVGIIEVNLVNAPFVTHSFAQGQRVVRLAVGPAMPVAMAGDGLNRYRVGCKAPPDPRVAPPGYYMMFAVNQGVPSVARWVQLVR